MPIGGVILEDMAIQILHHSVDDEVANELKLETYNNKKSFHNCCVAMVWLLLCTGCSLGSDARWNRVTDCFLDDVPTRAQEGEFSVLSYNVAGLPSWFSRSDPVHNIPLIGQKLNRFDLVLVQEDFWYHEELARGALHACRSDPLLHTPNPFELGDGLTRFSNLAFEGLRHIPWKTCHGTLSAKNDCLANKGFSVAVTFLTPNVRVHVYNLHMDAGHTPDDAQARLAQANQLADYLASFSSHAAVIVAGDTNLKNSQDQDRYILDDLINKTGLRDACQLLHCEEDTHDRVLVRSSANLSLIPREWTYASDFVNSSGDDLSDHKPILVRMSWKHIK